MTQEPVTVDIGAFVSHLESLGIALSLTGDRVRLSAPKHVLTVELRDELQARKAEILAYLASGRALETALEITPVGRDAPVPLAVAQERIWFLHQLDPASSAYHVGGAVKLTGRFVAAASERAWHTLARRHESLRTVFETVDGRPVMRILPSATPSMHREDLSATPADLRDAAVQRTVIDFMMRPFDIERGPLWRVLVIRLGDAEHVIAVSLHHLISDYWSTRILSREFCECYVGDLEGQIPALSPLRVQYADFAVAQRAWLDGPKVQAQLDYWREQLAGLVAPELPPDRPRVPGVTSPADGRVRLRAGLLASLRDLAASEQATPYMVMVAAFDVVLGRYTGSTDVAIGTPIANRPSADVEGIVGMFVNTLVLRADLSGNPTFRELLARVRTVALGAYANQDVSFDRVVSTLRPGRDGGRAPFFQVLFNSLDAPVKSVRLAGLEFEPVRLPAFALQFELGAAIETNELTDPPEHLLTFGFDRSLYDPATMTRLFQHYTRVLELVAADPDIRIDDIDLLDADERQQLLVDWNATSQPLADDATVVSLFEAQAARTPDAVAVVFGGTEVTYAELDRRAQAIAAGLRGLDLGPERIVGLCVHRSIDMVAAIYGVLKAGAAYVPLDPAFPADRLAFMVEDSTTSVILSEIGLRGTLPGAAAQVVCLDDPDDPFWRADVSTSDGKGPSQDDRAYVLYTSGSTGRPKGVEIAHRAFANFLVSMAREPGMTPADRLLAVTTLSFDIAGLELALPLITGARVILASREQAMDPAQLDALIRDHHVTFMQATPATWRLLLDDGWRGSPDLTILCGGEAMPRDMANRLVPRSRALWNMYGPTETTVWSTIERIDAGDEVITVGRPIANTQVYVLDPLLRPTPIGVPGELFIGGDGVARGYFKRPDLTASRFVPDPFRPDAGARMYRTGDLARFRADGRLECLGRLDTQVKVRGFRIELGEIESMLGTCAGVKQVAAVVRQDHGEAAIAAYVVPAGEAVSAETLRDHARQHLPPYMVPTFFVELPALPLTPNGKVDRNALPVPAAPRTGAVTMPANDLERELASIWAGVLNVPVVPVDENFFDLGGHSLLLAQVQRRIDDVLHEQVPMLDLLQYATVRALAARIGERPPEAGRASAARERMERQRAALERTRPARPFREDSRE
jgi:amino acid adenylation domain-containing protein